MNFLGTLITKRSVLIIAVSLLIILGLLVGTTKMQMATGNETLIDNESKVYRDNLMMEENFGGESIILLNESDDSYGILTPENLHRMKQIEDELKAHEGVYTIISPATIVGAMTEKQASKMFTNVNNVEVGLVEMGNKLIELGQQLEGKSSQIPQVDGGALNNDLGNSGAAFDKLINGQEKLSLGVSELGKGYSEFGAQLGQMSQQLEQLSLVSVENSGELQQMALGLNQMSQKMMEASQKSSDLQQVPEQTIQGLDNIENGLNEKSTDMQKLSGNLESMKDLGKMAGGLKEMGKKLLEISSGLDKLTSYSDVLEPGLPKEQASLDNLLYDEKGQLRDIFGEVVIDENNSIMVIKLTGDATDAEKDALVKTLEASLQEHSFEGVTSTVTGKPVLDSSLRTLMQDSMKEMVVLAVVLMTIVLLIVFKVRWRVVALPVIFLSVLATLGLMGFLNVPMTMVSMAVFPILIGLGVDYAIQFQNRYEEELSKEGV